MRRRAAIKYEGYHRKGPKVFIEFSPQQPAGDLTALIVSPDAFQRGRTYAVDCRTRTLIEAPKAPATTE